MSDIKYNTMRFLTDEFNPYIKQALLVSNEPIDLTNFNRLDQITILGNEPEGSKRRFLFKMDNKIYKFSGQNLVEYTGTVDIENVLANGNSAAQLEAVNNNSTLVGKNIFPIIALYSESENLPSAKIVATASLVQEVLDLEHERNPLYFHDEITRPDGGRVDGTILGFTWDIETNGNAQAGFKVQLLQNGEWTNYLTLTEAKGQTAQGVRSKWYYHVDAVDGINSVKIERFYAHWSPDTNFKVYGDTAYLTSVIKNFGLPLKSCVLVVRYEPLDGGSISADVAFLKNRKHVSAKVLGDINSAQKSFNLDENFIPSSLKLFINGVETTNFTFNTSDNSITLPADNDRAQATVSADFTYDDDNEIWLPMDADQPEPADNGLFTSRFFLNNPYNYSTPRAAIRLTINRGRDTKSTTRVATGQQQSITFSKEPDDISCDANDWDFDDDTNVLTFTSTEGQTVNVSYSWHGKTPVIRGWQAAFTI